MSETDYKQIVRERVCLYAARFKSQNDFARHVGVPQGTMSSYMNEQRGYTVPMAIAENCPDVSLEWLFRGIGTMFLGEVPTQVPESAPLPSPGHDPAVIKVLLDRIESQAVIIARLQEENTRYKAALNLK